MKPRIYSIHQINSYIKGLIEDDILLCGLFAEGEISGFKRHSSGHLYFTLKDNNAAINVIMFKSFADEIGFLPETGMKVIIYGRISVYEKTGQYQLYAEMIEPSGIGVLYAAFLQLKNKLEAEGIFDLSRKRDIPKNPERVAVVTSPTGAVIHDIITIAKRRSKNVEIIVIPVSVQGDNAVSQISEGIRLANDWAKADIIIVGRGGGSAEDLWPFNQEIVARTVYNSKIPVVSAVGHETDYTICDFAADLRAPTPSAAAEICFPDLLENIGHFERVKDELNQSISQKILQRKAEFSRITMPSPQDLTKNKSLILYDLKKRLSKEMLRKLEFSNNRAFKSIQALNLVAPLNVLKRGYSILYSGNEIISSISSVQSDEEITIRLFDGKIYAKTIRTEDLNGEEKDSNDS